MKASKFGDVTHHPRGRVLNTDLEMSCYSKRFYDWLGEINQLPGVTHFLGSPAVVTDNKTKKNPSPMEKDKRIILTNLNIMLLHSSKSEVLKKSLQTGLLAQQSTFHLPSR